MKSFAQQSLRCGLSLSLSTLLLSACTASVPLSTHLELTKNTSVTPHIYRNADSFEGKAQQLISHLQAEDFSAAENMLLKLTQEKTLTRGGTLMVPTIIQYALSGKATPTSQEQLITALLPRLDK
ncbi:MAG: hypothetical protein AB8B99_08365 [Phormidesmis sp.]